ncbi:FAD-dependent oxidoreductase [Oceanirhabdus seepicola]|uniref:FAD-dependent oxidoreductase n=1 Tax=Oceanirhabdus seepicola TaxID=2828781 RepID=A0A9J6NW94_9CLOT|nr:FAD-dependent oxidoreductase [Oceanirhabdus seepicola]MCM1988332.1 FAD-dependent oxidoreductase [Oceanirhabdus seepicola]
MKDKIIKAIKKEEELACYDIDVEVSSDKIITLTGEVDEWQHVVNIGHIVAKVKGVRNVVNDIKAKGITIPKKDNREKIKKIIKEGNHKECDIVIIGAGISGCAIARELSKYNLKTIVVEKNSDIAEEASKANNGNIHPGALAKPGTLKAKLNLKGNKLYTQLSEELNFELKRPGSLFVVYDEKEWKKMLGLKFLKKTGIGHLIKPLRQIMKVPGLKWLSGEEVHNLEPNIKGKPVGGFWMTTMGLVEPYEVCIALAENAVQNGTSFMLDTEVLDVITEEGKTTGVITNQCIINSKYVINCAGVYADNIAEMAGDRFFTIHPRRGAIAIIDKSRKGFLSTPAGTRSDNSGQKNNSKGGGACMTPEGNLLWGPTATEIPYKEDKSVEASDMDYIVKLGRSITEEVKRTEIITFFAGLRAADYKEDFIIGMSKKVKGFINVAGIQSPGLASAPAIAQMVEGIIKKDMGTIERNESYNPIRKPKVQFRNLSHEEQDELIKKNPKYGNIICRCELITEGEIIDAIHSGVPATTIDAVKRRTRAGMGRCQGGFCGPRVLDIIARELGKEPTEITLKGSNSYVLNKNSRG